MSRMLAGACLLLIAAAAAGDDVSVRVTLRDTGYLLGDLIDERVELRLPASMRIDPDSLPLPGRVMPWLEMRRARLEPPRADGVQEIVVTYQIFAEAEEATRAPLPAFKLRIRDGGETRTVEVPEQTFLLSPALPPTLTDRDRELRPSPDPSPLRESSAIAGALASMAVALLCTVYLLWRYDHLPFLPRTPGPLLRAWRRWRREAGRELSSAEHAELLRDVHAALNRSAGETLYPSTLRQLFDHAPYLAPLRERIENVFAASWDVFYGSPVGPPPPAPSVLALLRSAADRERGVPC